MHSFVYDLTASVSCSFFITPLDLAIVLCTYSFNPLGCFPSKSTNQCRRGSRRKGATTAAQAVLCQEEKVQFAPSSDTAWFGVTMPAVIEACTYVQPLAPRSTPATLAIAKHNHASPLTHAVHYGCTGLLALCWPFTRHSKCFARLVQLTRHRCSSFGALAAGSPANLTCSCTYMTQSLTHLCLLA